MNEHLHHAQAVPDWELISVEERSPVQQLAAVTHGLVTLANALTTMGHTIALVSVLAGKTPESRAIGFFAGRSFDAIDGLVAHATGTKSALGATIDAVGDKLSIGAAAIASVAREDIPPLVGGLIIGSSLLRSLVNTEANRIGATPKPNLAGKWSAAAESAALSSFMAAKALRRYPRVAGHVEIIARIMAGSAVALGGIALVGYTRDLRRAQLQRKGSVNHA